MIVDSIPQEEQFFYLKDRKFPPNPKLRAFWGLFPLGLDTDVKPLLSHLTTGELDSPPTYLRTPHVRVEPYRVSSSKVSACSDPVQLPLHSRVGCICIYANICHANVAGIIVLRFTGPPVPIMARVHATPQRPFPFPYPVSSSPFSPIALPLGPASITRRSVCEICRWYMTLAGRTVGA
eukprot:7393172-Pyramimonas_sp.AAC.1